IVLGITFVSGTYVLTDTLHNTFTTLFNNIYQHVDLQVRAKAEFKGQGGIGARPPIPETLQPRVSAVAGVKDAVGGVTGYAQFVAPNGKAVTTGGAPTLGVSFNPNPQMSSLRLDEGAAPAGPHEVAIDAATADKYNFKVG